MFTLPFLLHQQYCKNIVKFNIKKLINFGETLGKPGITNQKPFHKKFDINKNKINQIKNSKIQIQHI